MKKLLCLITVISLFVMPLGALAESEPATMDNLLSRAMDSVDALTAQSGKLTVQASAAVMTAPDIATVNVGISLYAADIAKAQEEANATVKAVIEAISALGVPANKITTSNYSIYPQRDYSSTTLPDITGYSISNNISVSLDDFAMLDKVIDTAVQNGANEIYAVGFDVADRSTLYRNAMDLAVVAAKEKAELLAAASGVTLEALSDITEVSSIENSYYMASNVADSRTMAAGEGSTSIQGGELNVTAQVQLVYTFKNVTK